MRNLSTAISPVRRPVAARPTASSPLVFEPLIAVTSSPSSPPMTATTAGKPQRGKGGAPAPPATPFSVHNTRFGSSETCGPVSGWRPGIVGRSLVRHATKKEVIHVFWSPTPTKSEEQLRAEALQRQQENTLWSPDPSALSTTAAGLPGWVFPVAGVGVLALIGFLVVRKGKKR